MLKATIDFQIKQSSGDQIKLPFTIEKAMIAETSFQVKIAAMHQQNQSENAKEQNEVLFERFKIEDEIFFEFGIEIEHFVMLRHEQMNKEGE